MREECPLCLKRISDWEAAGGKTIAIAGQIVHKSCVIDSDYSIKELENKIRQTA